MMGGTVPPVKISESEGGDSHEQRAKGAAHAPISAAAHAANPAAHNLAAATTYAAAAAHRPLRLHLRFHGPWPALRGTQPRVGG